jgi:predicted acetyltransferase
MMQLIRPTPSHLPRYIAALERGWSPDTTRGPEAAVEALEKIRASADSLFATVDDAQAQGPSWTAPDGTVHARIPGLLRWMWDDAPETPNEGEGTLPGFIGSINLRWMPGHAPLPSHILGHLGYAVVPWQRRRGHATRALGLLLPIAKAQGMPWVEITTDAENIASQRVITTHGGVLVEQFTKDAAWGSKPALRYRIDLS